MRIRLDALQKQYASLNIEKLDKPAYIVSRGGPDVKRTYAIFVQELYSKSLPLSWTDRGNQSTGKMSVRLLQCHLQQLGDKKVPFEKFILTCKLGKNYTAGTFAAAESRLAHRKKK